MNLSPVVLLCASLAALPVSAEPAVLKPSDLPRIDGIDIDGEGGEWAEAGLRIAALMPDGGVLTQGPWVRAAVSLGWDDQGLVMLAEVTDDQRVESSGGDIWKGDSVELFVADKRGSRERVQYMLGPTAEESTGVRTHVIDRWRSAGLKEKAEPAVKAAGRSTATGYVIEAMVPWTVLGLTPEEGLHCAVQVQVNDAAPGRQLQRSRWAVPGDAYADASQMKSVVLVGPGRGRQVAAAGGQWDRLRTAVVEVAATPDLSGSTIALLDKGVPVASASLQSRSGLAAARLRVPAKQPSYDPLTLVVAGEPVGEVELSDLDRLKAETLFWAQPCFESFVFNGEQFPRPEMRKPALIEDAIGPYRLETTFYDGSWNVVERAEKPGRYGAVVRLITDDGRVLTRYRTLFRTPVEWKPWEKNLKGNLDLPPAFGISEEVASAQQRELVELAGWCMYTDMHEFDGSARVLVGLWELSQPDSPLPADSKVSPWTLDRQWWVNLKRRLNGNDQKFTQVFGGPRAFDGEPATVLHEGSMAEAGMAEDAPQKIDAVLQAWAADTDEAFVACIVRNGVIVLHKAYGTRDGDEMTTDTKSYMASLSKLISGTCLMMLVDQAFMDLDAPADTYLPELTGAPFNSMPTLRNLYTHTAGMTTHRGEDDHDLEYVVRDFAAYMPVGQKFEYNGLSLELGMKALEQVSGLAYPMFVSEHLLEPLGCVNTDAMNASWNTRSTASDMATIGQMLLNGGRYGNLEFMSQSARDRMLPADLQPLVTEQTTRTRGIGTEWFTGDGLSDRCFGHGAASSATLRIDLEQNLIISMTRNAKGKNFAKYHPQFIQAVTGAIVPRPAVEPEAVGD